MGEIQTEPLNFLSAYYQPLLAINYLQQDRFSNNRPLAHINFTPSQKHTALLPFLLFCFVPPELALFRVIACQSIYNMAKIEFGYGVQRLLLFPRNSLAISR